MIEVEQTGQGDPLEFSVTVSKGPGKSEHEVRVPREDAQRLAPARSADALVEASFRFLLDREPKESILSSFELGVISRYFPEYEDEIGGYL